MKRKTQGISPKVSVPAIGEIVAGIVLLIVGLDVEGRSLIAAGFATLGLGAAANPGKVVEVPKP